MLQIVKSSFRTFVLKASGFNLFISVFVVAMIMLHSQNPSWTEFFTTWAHSLIYTFACGTLTTASFYFGERWLCTMDLKKRILIVLGFCVISGMSGAVVGRAVIALIGLPGDPSTQAAGHSFFQVIMPDWVHLLIFALMTTVFGLLIYGIELLLSRLEKAAGELKEKELQTERLLKLRAEAELKELQARINPHFLFNTLNSIVSLIAEDPKKAEDMTEKLSALFRYTLNVNRGNRVPLEQELHILQSYIAIEQLRLGERLQVRFEVEPGLSALRVPPLILQPIVENSVKYAVAAREEGGVIEVLGRRDGDRGILEVVDDGPGFDGQTKGAGQGLDNIRQRLDLYYGGAHRFLISRSGGKTFVRMEIPFQLNGDA
jgi:signal transduction histidine kinase